MKPTITLLILLFLVLCERPTEGQIPLLSKEVVGSLHGELSGEAAKRNLEFITQLHRMRGSAEFKEAINFVEGKLKEYKLQEVEVIQIPMDGKTFYGTQKSRLAWEAEFAELWELDHSGQPVFRLADWQSMPITLAEDSESGEVTSELIDIGAGSAEQDYAGKNVTGKLVLTSSPPDEVVPLAIEKYGAAGIVSYAQNQVTAWWKEDANLIRWGHLNSFSPTNTFCFMISLKQASAFQQRLTQGEKINLYAKVKAGRRLGYYSIVTAIIKGSDPSLQGQEIAYTCHLDHQRPGANDNASGSVTILEIARTLQKLIEQGQLQKPKRTLRFIWSPEIEGTLALLNQRPALAARIKANIHLDMVGGGPMTKSIFHVAAGPKSLPSFISGIGEAFGEYVNSETDAYASGYNNTFSFVSQEGGKEALQAVLGQFHMGSDHDVYQESSFKIPSIYMHDWPDRYIHTNFDMAANIDPTKLKRAGFIGAASGYFIANLDDHSIDPLWVMIQKQTLRTTSQVIGKKTQLSSTEFENLWANHFSFQRAVFNSLLNFCAVPASVHEESSKFYSQLEALHPLIKSPKTRIKISSPIYKRNAAIKGPLSVFGYDYFSDHLGHDKASTIRLLNYQGLWGHEYAYEALNFVDGIRSVIDIRNALSAEFGPIPVELVDEYLTALESIQVIQKVK